MPDGLPTPRSRTVMPPAFVVVAPLNLQHAAMFSHASVLLHYYLPSPRPPANCSSVVPPAACSPPLVAVAPMLVTVCRCRSHARHVLEKVKSQKAGGVLRCSAPSRQKVEIQCRPDMKRICPLFLLFLCVCGKAWAGRHVRGMDRKAAQEGQPTCCHGSMVLQNNVTARWQPAVNHQGIEEVYCGGEQVSFN